jgi:hypothetical protein
MDQAIATVATMTKDSGYVLEKTETGYRVLIDGVACGYRALSAPLQTRSARRATRTQDDRG